MTDRQRDWVTALLRLGLLLVLWGMVFAAEIRAAIRIWDSSTAYAHCWLVLPVALWLGWQRRGRLAALRPAPNLLLALPGLAAGLAWLLAEHLGLMEGRQLAALGLAWVLALAVLGLPVCRALAVPLLYLVFLVPFGAFLVPALQRITAAMIELGLRIGGIPHYVDALVIEIPAGRFLVAEACAGLRFLIAALAFGALYAAEMFRSPGRRLVVLVLSLVVPIVANGVRALGIVLVGHYHGSAEAAAADHVIYGWVFFSVVILVLVLAGLPFREEAARPACQESLRRPGVAPRVTSQATDITS
jgi:exosortase A